jgi:hypothetical protein
MEHAMSPKTKKDRKGTSDKAVAKALAATPAGATEILRGLIEEKQQIVTDGSLQVIMALTFTTRLVTLDLRTSPPRTTPANLGALRFNDPTVGLSNIEMAIFKGNLAALLPQIAADIANIPENAALKIGDVAEFVRLALLAA